MLSVMQRRFVRPLAGSAKPIRIAATARLTISSTMVNPLGAGLAGCMLWARDHYQRAL